MEFFEVCETSLQDSAARTWTRSCKVRQYGTEGGLLVVLTLLRSSWGWVQATTTGSAANPRALSEGTSGYHVWPASAAHLTHSVSRWESVRLKHLHPRGQ